MLIEFTLNNYRSYRTAATLSLETGERLTKRNWENTFMIPGTKERILKSVALFGANGSGKSTVIKGLALLKWLITQPTQAIGQELPAAPFRLDQASAQVPTTFNIVLTTAGYQYTYRLVYDRTTILGEQLKGKRLDGKSRQRVIFERQRQDVTRGPKALQEVVKQTRPNALLLYQLQAVNFGDAIRVFNWFQDDLIIFDERDARDFAVFDNQFMTQSQVQHELQDFLRAADVNVIGLTYREMPTATTGTTRYLFTQHKQFDAAGNVIGQIELPLAEESTGTQRIVLIALAIIESQRKGNQKTLVFDEFEEGLHVEMATSLLNLFNSEQNLNQVILATYQLALLDADIRVDQIYFTEKNYRGESELYSLFDYGDAVARSDVAFSKRYQKGQFGATPVIQLADFQRRLHGVGKDR